MDKIIVYVDDADHAQQLLAPLVARPPAAHQHWVLVACAPRMTHRVSKWVSHSARESWRTKWADKLFAQITTSVGLSPAQVTTVLAKGPLAELTEQLQADLQANGSRTAPVMDARKPRSTEAAPQPLTPRAATELAPSPAPRPSHWPRVLGSVLTGCGTLWALALD